MKNFKKSMLILSICAASCSFYLFPMKAEAATASEVADKCITYTAQGTYYLTKYTLKTCWFIIKKTTKGAIAVSKSVFFGTEDAFISNPKSNQKAKPVVKIPAIPVQKPIEQKPDNIYTLPAVPKV